MAISTPLAVAGRLRRAGARTRRRVEDLLPPTRTALRVPPDRRGPQPGAFAAFGEGSWIVPPTRVEGAGHISVGGGVVILENATLVARPSPAAPSDGALLRVGDRVRLARFCVIAATVGVDIGDDVSSSDGAAVVDTWGPYDLDRGQQPPIPASPIVIEPGAYLGALSIVGPGVRVGTGAFVGEGAVVLDDVPPHTLVYGNPARVVRRWRPEDRQWQGEPRP